MNTPSLGSQRRTNMKYCIFLIACSWQIPNDSWRCAPSCAWGQITGHTRIAQREVEAKMKTLPRVWIPDPRQTLLCLSNGILTRLPEGTRLYRLWSIARWTKAKRSLAIVGIQVIFHRHNTLSEYLILRHGEQRQQFPWRPSTVRHGSWFPRN